MSPRRAVLLDVDGTLVDSNDLHAEAWREALADHGYHVAFERVRSLIGMGGDKLLPALSGLSDQSSEGDAISTHRSKLFMRRYLPKVKPFPNVRELLLRMREDGYRLVVATSASRDELGGLLRCANVQDLLHDETSADDADRSKPDPDIVCAALRKAGVEASEAIMLGDTPYDVEAATRAGVVIVGLRSGGYDAEGLRGALATYRDPQDLLESYASSPFARKT
jgi:HAD superfamily hydrolase (TIGR01509 family)